MGHHTLGFLHAALLRQPARAFGQAQPDPPDDDSGNGTGPCHPAPAVIAERRLRDQLPGQEIGHQEGDGAHGLQECESRTAGLLWHQLGEIGINRHQLKANSKRADEAPQIHAIRCVLHSHDEVGDAEPQQGVSENRAPPEMVGDIGNEQRGNEEAGEQRGDEAGEAGEPEEAHRCRGEDAGLEQARTERADQSDCVTVEESSERQQDRHDPQSACHRQSVEPCRKLFSGCSGPDGEAVLAVGDRRRIRGWRNVWCAIHWVVSLLLSLVVFRCRGFRAATQLYSVSYLRD